MDAGRRRRVPASPGLLAGRSGRSREVRRNPAARSTVGEMATGTGETRYTTTPEGAYLAYQVTGSGSLDLVMPITGSAAVELLWDEPHFKRFIGRLSSMARVVTFDPRGF